MSLRVPSYYVLSRACPVDDVNAVLAILSLTPIDGVIVSNIRDFALAVGFGGIDRTIKVVNDAHALDMAAYLAKPEHNALVSLVIGELRAGVVRMVYADGSHEEIEYATQA